MKNNVFEAHGISKLSPNQFNKFVRDPAKWLVNTAGYYDQQYSPAFTNGNAVESMLNAALNNLRLKPETCIAHGLEVFDEIENMKLPEDQYSISAHNKNKEKCLKFMPDIIKRYRSLGKPIAIQEEVEFQIDDFPVPIVGRVDYLFEDSVRDLKTASREPKEVSDFYGRQLSFYSLATGKPPIIDYVYMTTTKADIISFEVPNVDQHIEDIYRIVRKMERLLSLSDDITEVCRLSCLEPNLSNDNFMNFWSPTEIEGAKKLFINI